MREQSSWPVMYYPYPAGSHGVSLFFLLSIIYKIIGFNQYRLSLKTSKCIRYINSNGIQVYKIYGKIMIRNRTKNTAVVLMTCIFSVNCKIQAFLDLRC